MKLLIFEIIPLYRGLPESTDSQGCSGGTEGKLAKHFKPKITNLKMAKQIREREAISSGHIGETIEI